MKKLSVVISAYNEERKLPACLASVSFADEIIVVDNQSSDKTEEIARKAKAIVYSRPNNIMLNTNKNFGFTKAKGDWILSLDADERVTSELREEVQGILSADIAEDIAGFAMPRKNIIFGKWIQHTGWYPDHQMRLFRKGKGRFSERHVHEQMQVDGQIEKLKHPLLHESYDTIHSFLVKLFTIYAVNEAENLVNQDVCISKNGKDVYERFTFSWRDAVAKPAAEFINRFYTKEGYKDGVHGLMLSLLMGFYYFVVYAYVWEKEKFADREDKLLDEVNKQLGHIGKEGYWQLTAKIENTENVLEKSYFKIKRRMLRL